MVAKSAYWLRVGSHEGRGRVTEIASKPSNPCARSEDLIVEELGEELLIYDMKVDRGHCLSPVAARVWRRCDGRTHATAMSAELGLDTDAVGRALAELTACKLLQPTPVLSVVAVSGDGTTRRELATRFVKAGAVAAAAPLIVSVAAPTPAQAQTLGFCSQFNSDAGCGTCQQNGCCCCAQSTTFAVKLCVPNTPAGNAICCGQFGAGTAFDAGCVGVFGCVTDAETESTGLETQTQDAVTEPPPTEPTPTEPARTEPTPTPEAPATETPAAPTAEAPATGGSTTPPTSEGASNP